MTWHPFSWTPDSAWGFICGLGVALVFWRVYAKWGPR
jgi:hypothetical protein